MTPTSERRVWTDAEKRTILAAVELGTPISEVAREHGVNTSTIYYWRNTFGKPEPGAVAAKVKGPKKRKRRAPPPAAAPVPPQEITVQTPARHLHDERATRTSRDPRGLSYEQLLDENARLRAALLALLLSQ